MLMQEALHVGGSVDNTPWQRILRTIVHLCNALAMTDHQPSTSNLLTSVETATRLGIDRGTLTRWVQGGRIAPAMKLPGKNGPALFAPADVASLKAELEAASTT